MKYTQLAILLLWGVLSALPCSAQDWLWAKANSGSGIDAWPVATDKSGNVFAAGVKWGLTPAVFGSVTVPFTGVSGFQSIVTKYDAAGNFLWARGTQNGNSCPIGIATDPTGNVYLFGSMLSKYLKIGIITLTNEYASINDVQYFLAKYDANGNVLWAVSGGNTQTGFASAVGNIAYVLGVGGVATDAAGNAYITANFHMPVISIGGHALHNTDATGGTDDIFLARYDAAGNVVWAKSMGGAKKDDAYSIAVTPAGDVYLAGAFLSPSLSFGSTVLANPASGYEAFIARFDASGNPLWADASAGQGSVYALGLAADVANNVYLTGGLKDNSISFAGTAIANPHPGKASAYLVKFDPSDHVSWYKTIYSPLTTGTAWGYAVATSLCGDVWVTGAMSRTDSLGNPATVLPIVADVDGHLIAVPSQSADPIFIAGYSSSGAYVGASALESGGDDQVGLASDAHGNVFLCGDYDSKTPFTAAGATFPVDTLAVELMYLAKFAPYSKSSSSFRHSDTTFCYNAGSVVLTPAPGHANYIWHDGHTGPTYNVVDTGVFSVWAYDNCAGSDCDTFRISGICDCSAFFFVPNTFTPNGDGLNDLFYPRSSRGNTRVTTFRVYNRWGELLFERENIMTNDVSNAWDGSFQGNLALPDVYVYIVDAICENGTVINKKGSVTVIR